MNKILSTTSMFADESPELIEAIEKHDLLYVPNVLKRRVNSEELTALLREHQPVGILAGTELIGRAELDQARGHLRVISRVGVGWENIDREFAATMNILVFRTPGVLTEAVAELTIGFMLSALRFITCQDRLIRNSQWRKQMGSLLQGKVVGIIGYGDIGRRVGELVDAFGASVIICDVQSPSLPRGEFEQVNIGELLSRADIITIHASGNHKIIGPDEFGQIKKKEVVLINTARGGLIDEDALYENLLDGTIGYACLDVFTKEPYVGKLLTLENVLLTPHIGSYARESRKAMETMAVANLINGLKDAGILER
jgi:D-3-phosphoglycerate dehydrogenase